MNKGPGLFLRLVTLGDHLVHHLFPTVDQSKLDLLYPALQETCQEFGLDQYKYESLWEMVKGTHIQMARSKPMTYQERMELRVK